MPYSKRPIHYSHRQRSKFSLFTRWHSAHFPTKLTIICGIFLISDYFLTRAQPSSANQHSRCGIATRGAVRTFGEGLRRQHCSSLCLQSEGHEHVANIASALGHIFVGFLARAWPPQYSPPHFASKVSYSASPQASAKCSRDAPCSDAALACSASRSSPFHKRA